MKYSLIGWLDLPLPVVARPQAKMSICQEVFCCMWGIVAPLVSLCQSPHAQWMAPPKCVLLVLQHCQKWADSVCGVGSHALFLSAFHL